mmetsp:Transcript_21839/g.40927  ORF Transcript_21839/g.40927 Transcript_21839/m.40927 type:complete len:255 (-) Transcript_21839:644-1408(-)
MNSKLTSALAFQSSRFCFCLGGGGHCGLLFNLLDNKIGHLAKKRGALLESFICSHVIKVLLVVGCTNTQDTARVSSLSHQLDRLHSIQVFAHIFVHRNDRVVFVLVKHLFERFLAIDSGVDVQVNTMSNGESRQLFGDHKDEGFVVICHQNIRGHLDRVGFVVGVKVRPWFFKLADLLLSRVVAVVICITVALPIIAHSPGFCVRVRVCLCTSLHRGGSCACATVGLEVLFELLLVAELICFCKFHIWFAIFIR